MHTYMHTYIHTYIHADIHADIDAYIHVYMHAYTHTYVHTYIHIYIHTYIHTYNWFMYSPLDGRCCTRHGTSASSLRPIARTLPVLLPSWQLPLSGLVWLFFMRVLHLFVSSVR